MSGQARLREVGAGGAALELDEKRFSRLGWRLVLLGFVGFLRNGPGWPRWTRVSGSPAR